MTFEQMNVGQRVSIPKFSSSLIAAVRFYLKVL